MLTVVDAWFDSVETPVGRLYAARSAEGICLVGLKCSSDSQFHRLAAARGIRLIARSSSRLRPFFDEVAAYLSGDLRKFRSSVDLAGVPPFQHTALRQTARIPYGRTASYGEVARRSGSPRAARAVGSAMAANPVPLLIPCHRVILANGETGRYGGGAKLKSWLLRLEASRNVS